MRDASEIHSRRILFVAVFVASLCVLPARAQKRPEPTSPKYDLHTETKNVPGSPWRRSVPERAAGRIAGESQIGQRSSFTGAQIARKGEFRAST